MNNLWLFCEINYGDAGFSISGEDFFNCICKRKTKNGK